MKNSFSSFHDVISTSRFVRIFTISSPCKINLNTFTDLRCFQLYRRPSRCVTPLNTIFVLTCYQKKSSSSAAPRLPPTIFPFCLILFCILRFVRSTLAHFAPFFLLHSFLSIKKNLLVYWSWQMYQCNFTLPFIRNVHRFEIKSKEKTDLFLLYGFY